MTNPTSKQPEWEKKFDNIFPFGVETQEVKQKNFEEENKLVKAFISTQLTAFSNEVEKKIINVNEATRETVRQRQALSELRKKWRLE